MRTPVQNGEPLMSLSRQLYSAEPAVEDPVDVTFGALPEGTPSDARMKKIFMNNCTGCHPPGYILQFRFDEPGWNKVIDLMKVVPGTGVYPGPNARVNEIMAQ